MERIIGCGVPKCTNTNALLPKRLITRRLRKTWDKDANEVPDMLKIGMICISSQNKDIKKSKYVWLYGIFI